MRTLHNIDLKNNESGFSLRWQDRLILSHSADAPCLWIGAGEADIEMFRGNFSIKDKLNEKIALTNATVTQQSTGWAIRFTRGDAVSATLLVGVDAEGRLELKLKNDAASHNRIWLRLAAQPDDHIYGCGEQFSYFDLRGKPFPLWTSEQGVGRNKQTYVTWQADCKENAGGDYYWTFFPQPTFVSTQKYYCHVDNSCYMNFDFSAPDFHELAFWEDNATLRFECAETYVDLLEKLTGLLGRQPELPDWVYDGVTLGIQGGTEVCQQKLDAMREGGVKVNGIWAQDWSGIRMTSFGKRVMWNWKWNSALYPQLDERIAQWKQEGVQFLSYINPYVASDKDLCEEAAKRGYLTKNANGEDYHVEFGEFYAGVIDLTNPAAYGWYKEVIKKNLIELGCGGWMADFGEYLPTDTFLHNGVSAEIMHNAWPALWAKCNYEALEETGKLGEILFFMRAGYTGSQKHSVMMWAGDQNVDWSLDDGLASVVPAAVSGDDRARAAPQRHWRLYDAVRDEAQQRAAAALVRFQRLYADDAYPRGQSPWRQLAVRRRRRNHRALRAHDHRVHHPEAVYQSCGCAEREKRPAGDASAVPALRGRRARLHAEIPVPVWPRPAGGAGS